MFPWHSDAGVPACSDALADELDRANRGYNSYVPHTGEVMRVVTDLRHRDMSGYGSQMTVGEPSAVLIASHPFATRVRAGQRLILAIGGGNAQLQPDVFKPVITVSTGDGFAGRITLPLVAGTLRFMTE